VNRCATQNQVNARADLDWAHFPGAAASSRLTGGIGSRNNPNDT
jgi:hypothetical protein